MKSKVIIGLVITVTTVLGGIVGSNIGYEKAQKELVFEHVEIEMDKKEYTQVAFEDVKDDTIKARMRKMGIESYNKYVIPLSNGSTIVALPQVDRYYFMPYELGDWDYKIEGKENIEKIVNTYISMKGKGKF